MKKELLIAVLAAYIIVRAYIASLSSYGFYHGWNEGYYSLIAKNYFSGSLWEQVSYPGSGFSPSVPPFFSYVVYASFKMFGISDISARLVSILSEVIAALGVYMLAKELYDERAAGIAALIFISIPWNILWFGRAQTDTLMTALLVLAVALYVRAYKNNKSMLPFGITLGLAVFTKQPALAALPVVLLWSYFQGIKKRQIINAMACFIAGMVPLLIWLSYYGFSGNYDVIINVIYVRYGSELFSDMARIILLTTIGMLPIIIFAVYQMFKERDIKNILAIWLFIYGAFALARAPPSHEYYSLPLTAPIAISAGAGFIKFFQTLSKKYSKVLLLVAVIALTLCITYVLLSYSGDSGYTSSKDVGNFLRNYMDENPNNDYLVLVQMKYSPQIAWYTGLRVDGREQIYSTTDDISVQYVDGIIGNSDKKVVFLVADSAAARSVATEYEKVYTSLYDGNLLNLGEILGIDFKFGQGMMVFKLR